MKHSFCWLFLLAERVLLCGKLRLCRPKNMGSLLGLLAFCIGSRHQVFGQMLPDAALPDLCEALGTTEVGINDVMLRPDLVPQSWLRWHVAHLCGPLTERKHPPQPDIVVSGQQCAPRGGTGGATACNIIKISAHIVAQALSGLVQLILDELGITNYNGLDIQYPTLVCSTRMSLQDQGPMASTPSLDQTTSLGLEIANAFVRCKGHRFCRRILMLPSAIGEMGFLTSK